MGSYIVNLPKLPSGSEPERLGSMVFKRRVVVLSLASLFYKWGSFDER